MTHQMPLPGDHLDRLFGRNMQYSGWTVDIPAPANDDAMLINIDPALLLSMFKRGNR